MATYKKTGSKNRNKKANSIEQGSTTAEVFNTLDETASKSEQWIIKNQNIIFIVMASVVVLVLAFMGYQKYIAEPNEKEAANELAYPKKYFNQAQTSSVAVDSLYTLGLEGADGKYGFIDIADKYSRTDAGNLANYYAGISYLKMKKYEEAINYLDKFKSDDDILGPVAKGAIGDAFADIDQLEDALEYYEKAASLKENSFSTPLFLFKAANTAMDLGEYKKALTMFTKIKKEYPTSEEGKDIDVYINKATYASEK